MRISCFVVLRQDCLEAHNLVLIIEPTGGPIYRKDMPLMVGDESSVEKVADTIHRAAQYIAARAAIANAEGR